jgi:1-acyl-sn-glycerol-3-phosphate acyltransferase
MTSFAIQSLRVWRLVGLALWSCFACSRLALWLVLLPIRDERKFRARHTHGWAKGAAAILGLRFQVQGSLPVTGTLWVSNHVGYLDIVSLAALSPVVFVCKSEVAHWPILGILARLSGALFLERGNARAAMRVNATIEKALSEGMHVVVFPEGTSSDGRDVLPFKSALFQSAAQGGFPVKPLAMRYRRHASQALGPLAWYGDADFASHFWRVLAHRWITVQIHVARFSILGADRRLLAKAAHASVRHLLRPGDLKKRETVFPATTETLSAVNTG